MNILFVHEIDWLKTVVFELHTLSELLSRRGHRVFALDYEDHWRPNGHGRLGDLGTRSYDVARAYPDARVTLVRPGFVKVPAVSRCSAFYTHYRELDRLLSKEKIDVIVLYSVPTNGLQTLWLAKRHGIPVVFRSVDILHQLVPHALLRPPTSFLEDQVYRRVDLVLALTPYLAKYVVRKGARPERVKLLPPGVDTVRFCPRPPDAGLRRKLGLGENDAVVLFLGTLFDFSGLDLFLREFPGLLAQVPEARLLIVGDGPQRPALEAEIDRLGLRGKVTITGFQPFETMPDYINLATVCVNAFRLNGATRDIIPSKVVQYLACGKALVATPLPGMVSVLPGEECGVAYRQSAEELTAEIASLLRQPERRRHLEDDGLRYVRQTHGYDTITRQLESYLAEVTQLSPTAAHVRREIA